MLPPLHNAVFLDTETTGLSSTAQVLEVAVVDCAGAVLLDARSRPTCTIEPGAAAVHGITADMLTDAPDFPAVWRLLLDILTGRKIGIYNADFDLRMLAQTARAHGLDTAPLPRLDTWCVMKSYARFWGNYDPYRQSFRWQTLTNAIDQQHLTLPAGMRLHSALADAEMTRQLALKMAEV